MPSSYDYFNRPVLHRPVELTQYRSVVYGESMAESKVVASVGSRGDSYDNAMAEALNSVFKAELIDRRTWSTLTDVLVATSAGIEWYNSRRLHSAVSHRPPAEVHQEWKKCQVLAA